MAFSFFDWLASLFIGDRTNPDRAKKRIIKRMTKALAANRYGKFFRSRSGEASPDLAQFFYGIYKVVAQAQALLQNAAQSTQLKICTVVTFLYPKQLDLLKQLSGESLENRAMETAGGLLARQAQGEFEEFSRGFDAGQTNAINECYNLILIFHKFVVYDYYFLLKKFDSQLTERSFSRKPVFNPLRGEIVVENLKDFLELTGSLDPNRDWDTPLRILKEFKGTEAIDPKLWNKLLLRIRDVVQSGIFEMIIRFIEKNPDWTWEPHTPGGDIVGAYLETIRRETFERLDLIASSRRNALIDRHAAAVFGNDRVNRLKYYTELGGEIYKRKNFSGFVYAKALNYLIVFLTDGKSEIQNLYELILIRGRWVSTALCLPLSESLRLIAVFPGRITEMDEMVSDQGIYGNKLKTAIMKVDREKSMTRSININLEAVNREAKQILNDAIFNLSVLSDGLKDILEDRRKAPGIIILNWDELESFSETDLEGRIAATLDKLNNMLELLRVLSQSSSPGDALD
ncbi:MAG: DUF5312 domain-containing protein [Treponema sp.]|jgi:hypothetical protein|nr:DUF5312 domain-containing protein [Treponema sp.]